MVRATNRALLCFKMPAEICLLLPWFPAIWRKDMMSDPDSTPASAPSNNPSSLLRRRRSRGGRGRGRGRGGPLLPRVGDVAAVKGAAGNPPPDSPAEVAGVEANQPDAEIDARDETPGEAPGEGEAQGGEDTFFA